MQTDSGGYWDLFPEGIAGWVRFGHRKSPACEGYVRN